MVCFGCLPTQMFNDLVAVNKQKKDDIRFKFSRETSSSQQFFLSLASVSENVVPVCFEKSTRRTTFPELPLTFADARENTFNCIVCL